ncbi:MAG: HPr family phosphocarrier protein [Planctomycetaceae bacterium]
MDGTATTRRSVTLGIKNGLHLSPISRLVQAASQCSSAIRIRFDDKVADAKSVYDLMLLGATHGAPLEIEADGDDAEIAIAVVAAILDGTVAAPLSE